MMQMKQVYSISSLKFKQIHFHLQILLVCVCVCVYVCELRHLWNIFKNFSNQHTHTRGYLTQTDQTNQGLADLDKQSRLCECIYPVRICRECCHSVQCFQVKIMMYRFEVSLKCIDKISKRSLISVLHGCNG